MNNVVTFYSYKGGVGRTMAMANVAVLLAQRGLKVLVVDWDLEAPGLDRYFGYFDVELPKNGGLLPLLQQQRRGSRSHYAQHLAKVVGKAGSKSFTLDLLPSGRDSYSRYLETLEGFDWDRYFEQGGGDFIEELRNRWRSDYDVTLIDSRTGLSDTGGICTIQLPDVVVALFTANYQSLHGVLDTKRLAQAARDGLEYDRMHLRVLPVPTRFSQRPDTVEATEWLGRIAEVLAPFYTDWLASGVSPLQMASELRIPQVDSFGLGEKLAVVERDAAARAMTSIYERIANLLTLPPTEAEAVAAFSVAASGRPLPARATAEDYKYDIFVSHAANSVQVEWLDEFVKVLREACRQRLGRDVHVFVDHSELRSGSVWPDEVREALLRSRVLLAYVTPTFVDSRWCRVQWAAFEERERSGSGHGLIIPLLPRALSSLPEWIRGRQTVSIAELPAVPSELKRGAKVIHASVGKIAASFVESILGAPSFNRDWKVIDIEDAPAVSALSSAAEPPPDGMHGSISVDAIVALLEKDPQPEALEHARGFLETLVSQSDFGAAVRVGNALRDAPAGSTPESSLSYAFALLETGAAREALKVLGPIVKRKHLPPALSARARSLVALACKQRYVAETRKGGRSGAAALKRAIAAFRDALKADNDVGVAIDFLALRSAARRLKISTGTLETDKRTARSCLKRLARVSPSLRERSYERSVAELNLALGRWREFETHLGKFLSGPRVVRELTDVHAQLTDIWNLEAIDARGRPLVDAVRAQLLATTGGTVSVMPAAVKSAAEGAQRRSGPQRVLEPSAAETLLWWKTGLQRAQSVGSVQRRGDGATIATCFAVNPRDFGFDLDEAVVMTAAHVIDPPAPIENFRFEFAGEETVHAAGAQVLWQSPSDQFDAVIVRLEPALQLQPLPIAPRLPALDSFPSRVYLVGHAGGRQLSFSFQDNELLDHDADAPEAAKVTRVHYRAATGGGSSGSPVFNRNWQLIAIHHMGGENVPRLNGKDGTYAAGEGVGILSIARAARLKDE